MIILKTGRGDCLDSAELEVTIKVKNTGLVSSHEKSENEQRYWADLIIDKLREQRTGGGWKIWKYEQIKVEYIPD